MFLAKRLRRLKFEYDCPLYLEVFDSGNETVMYRCEGCPPRYLFHPCVPRLEYLPLWNV